MKAKIERFQKKKIFTIDYFRYFCIIFDRIAPATYNLKQKNGFIIFHFIFL